MRPPRKIVTRSPHRRVGYIVCPWMQPDPIGYESLLEAGFVRIAALCPHVLKIRHQPFRLELGEGIGSYTPDFYLDCRGARGLVVEVKPSAHIRKHLAKLQAAKSHLGNHNCDFLVCTEAEIYHGERADRASEILRYARSILPAQEAATLSARLPSLPYPASVSDLATSLETSVEQVLYFVGRRYLQVGRDLSTEWIEHHTDGGNGNGDFSARAWLGGASW